MFEARSPRVPAPVLTLFLMGLLRAVQGFRGLDSFPGCLRGRDDVGFGLGLLSGATVLTLYSVDLTPEFPKKLAPSFSVLGSLFPEVTHGGVADEWIFPTGCISGVALVSPTLRVPLLFPPPLYIMESEPVNDREGFG